MIAILAAWVMTHPPIPAYQSLPLEDLSYAINAHAERKYKALPPGVSYELAREFDAVGRLADVDPLFIAGLTYTESRWSGGALGDGGASVGLYQMVASSVRSVLPRLSRKQARKALADPLQRVLCAGYYWRRVIRRYGRTRAAVVFNCGPVRCKKLKHTRVTRGYFRNYKQIRGGLKGE